MKKDIDNILISLENEINLVHSIKDCNKIKSKYLNSNGVIRSLLSKIKYLPIEEKKYYGYLINKIKKKVVDFISLNDLKTNKKYKISSIDPTLPVKYKGSFHPLTIIKDKVINIFKNIGFKIFLGTEIESEWYCFDALNTPKNHPARDNKDTFYLKKNLIVDNVYKASNERYLLRTHTSSVQVRTFLNNKPPIKAICPGRAFRRDTLDSTHSPSFHQIEGFVIDKNINIIDLKEILFFFIKTLFGNSIKIKFRTSSFPFTKPSFELDIYSKKLGKLSNKWIEVMGCGLIHPNVLKNCKISNIWQGLAFGIGLERLTMIYYGIDDIRYFFNNDYRFIKQFI